MFIKDEDKTLEFLPASCLKREGVDTVKNRACEMLLEQRVERKVAQTGKVDAIKNRVYVTATTARSDRQSKERLLVYELML
mmetsp:Transcript_10573/g.8997  ORF Transcript_10573/g.8997 Transcript_10573/m.8997 type:complete len:81 (+) Transcript_10573:257-499(+)